MVTKGREHIACQLLISASELFIAHGDSSCLDAEKDHLHVFFHQNVQYSSRVYFSVQTMLHKAISNLS